MRRTLGLASILLTVGCARDHRPVVTTFYSTYGYLDEAGDEWTIPLRIWVHSPHAKTQAVLQTAAAGLGSLSAGERDLLRERIADIVADSRSEQEVRFAFDKDPQGQVYQIATDVGDSPLSDRNGLIVGSLELSRARAEEILRAQGSTAWLTFHETTPGREGAGRIVLIPPEGRSVVSDVDDTIKVTEIPAGAKIVVRNTFLRDFVAAPGMVDRYKLLTDEGCVFHFVSGGPWQLHGPLSTFLTGAGYPEGTFHMKEAPKNLLAPATWDGLYKLAGPDATLDHKTAQISALLERFPRRKFTLIGDSGEKDPEVYRAIRDRFGSQVEAIYIRHVLPDEQAERLAGMELIAADPVLPGVSRLGG